MLLNYGVGEDFWESLGQQGDPTVHPKGNQSFIFIGLMLKLKLQFFVYLMQRTDSFEKTLMLGKIEGERRGWQRMWWLNGITDLTGIVWACLGVGGGLGGLACWSPWGCRVWHDWATELMNWTDLLCLSVLLQVSKFLNLFKEPALYFIDFIYCFPDFNFINFCFYSFLPFAGFEYVLSFWLFVSLHSTGLLYGFKVCFFMI